MTTMADQTQENWPKHLASGRTVATWQLTWANRTEPFLPAHRERLGTQTDLFAASFFTADLGQHKRFASSLRPMPGRRYLPSATLTTASLHKTVSIATS